MKKWLKELFAKLFGKAKKKVAEKIPEVVKTKEEKKGCGCDLSILRQRPRYSPEGLAALGNTAECPVPFGKDLRLMVVLPDNSIWLIGMLFARGAVTVSGNTYTCHCFDADDGRYHYLGHCKDDHAKNIILQAPETPNEYTGTEFVAFEWRPK